MITLFKCLIISKKIEIMENSNLYSYLDNIENYSILEIREKILSLTENANLELIFDLRANVYNYYKLKFIQLHPDKITEPDHEVKASDDTLLYTNLIYPFFNGYSDKFADLNIKFGSHVKNKIQNSIDRFWCKNSLSHIDYFVQKLSPFNRELDQILIEQLSLSNLNKQHEDLNKNKRISLTNQRDSASTLEDATVDDLSNSKIVQKLIFLNELGVIDYLRERPPFNTSINKLATILSAITGEKSTSIQPSLNALITDNTLINKNNPYFNKNNITKVKQRLIDIGYNI